MELQKNPDSTPRTDAQDLHQRCCSADPAVAGAAFQQLGQFLLRIAHSKIADQPHLAHLAEECAQQALVTIWKKLSAGNGPDHVEWFLTWSASIVIHKVLDELRKVAKSRSDSLEEHLEQDTLLRPPLHTANAPAPDAYTIEHEDKALFVELIRNHPRLSPEAKLVLLRGYLLELDDDQLAVELGKARATIRVLRFRGLKLLRDDPEFMTQVSALTLAAVA